MFLSNVNLSNNPEFLLILPESIAKNTPSIITNYLQPLGQYKTKVAIAGVFVPQKGVLKKAIFEEEWEQIKEVLDTYGITKIGIANPYHLKFMLNMKKNPQFERMIGSVFKVENKYQVTPILNYYAVRIQPTKKKLLDRSVQTMFELLTGTYQDDREEFLNSLNIELITDYKEAFKKLKEYFDEPYLAVDIETTGLKWYSDELLTISFSKSETEGFCIALHEKYSKDWKKNREVVRKFFEKYKGNSILHNAAFDIPFLVYNFWMEHITDTKNMIKGVNYFNLEDTMIMAYLCLNHVDKPKLSLKDLAYIRYGNWDNDIDQAKLLAYDFEDVGKYNTIDTMATMYVFNQFKDRLVIEEQDKLYNEFYRKLIPAIIKMKMNGITIDINKVKILDKKLSTIYKENLKFLNTTDEVKETIRLLKEKAKKQGKRQSEINKIIFNAKSTNHLRVLLFDVMGFEPIKFSKKSGEPSTDKEVIESLLEIATEEQKPIMKALKEISEMKTIYSTFVKIFEDKSVMDKKGNWKLFPEYIITGTISGRMAGKEVNLLNIPSKGTLGKAVKDTIIAQDRYIVAQIDSDNLEDKLMATVSSCKNKIKVFTNGLDAHCLNSYMYFKEEFNKRGIFIDINNPEEVNKIAELAPDLRQESKRYTFKESYQGITEFHDKYVELYKEIFDYRDRIEEQLLEKGYVKGFFGLKARGNLSDIKSKEKYSSALRSLFNQTIQSGALIILRAIFLLQEWIENKGYEEKIKITNSVYDSIYLEVYKDEKIIYELNKAIVEFMCPDYSQFTKLPKNTTYIPLTATLEIGKSWIAEEKIPNNANLSLIKEKLDKILEK